MAVFSKSSQEQLATCDERLQRLANEAIVDADFAILEGHRGEEAQNRAFAKGASKLPWPKGNHNAKPSRAFDFSPWPIDWDSSAKATGRFMFIAGVLHAHARAHGIKIRFGWDWNRNLDPRDETFMDWGHVELDEP